MTETIKARQQAIIFNHQLECVPESSDLFPSFQCTETETRTRVSFCVDGTKETEVQEALARIVQRDCLNLDSKRNTDDGFCHGWVQQSCQVAGEVQIERRVGEEKGILQKVANFFWRD